MKRTSITIAAALWSIASAGADLRFELSAAEINRAVFELGAELGIVERGSRDGAKSEVLVEHLVRAKQMMRAARIGSAEGIDKLIAEMESAEDSQSVHAAVGAFRERLGRLILPERAATLPLIAPPPPEPEAEPVHCDASTWEGTWDTNWGVMSLTHTGDGKFSGTYGGYKHSLEGALEPNEPCVFSGVWKHSTSTMVGRFRFKITTDDARFEGKWTGADADPAVGGSRWYGAHRDRALAVEASTVGPAKVTTSAGKRSFTQKIRIKNVFRGAFYLFGYSSDSPFIQTFTLNPKTGQWTGHGPLYCGTGASFHRIPRGGSFTAEVTLPEAFSDHDFAIEFVRYPKAKSEDGVTVRSAPLRMVLEKTQAPAEESTDG